VLQRRSRGAVDACVTPIVSAVGHETDVSISDFVADVRAHPPGRRRTAAGPDQRPASAVESLHRRLVLRMRDRLMRDRLRLEGMARRLRHPASVCASRRSAWMTWTCACAAPSSSASILAANA
jgi:exonuclease VII large subunit